LSSPENYIFKFKRKRTRLDLLRGSRQGRDKREGGCSTSACASRATCAVGKIFFERHSLRSHSRLFLPIEFRAKRRIAFAAAPISCGIAKIENGNLAIFLAARDYRL
jgi:hypothetical protein